MMPPRGDGSSQRGQTPMKYCLPSSEGSDSDERLTHPGHSEIAGMDSSKGSDPDERPPWVRGFKSPLTLTLSPKQSGKDQDGWVTLPPLPHRGEGSHVGPYRALNLLERGERIEAPCGASRPIWSGRWELNPRPALALALSGGARFRGD